MSLDGAARTPTGTELIDVQKFDDAVDGVANIKRQQASLGRHPARFLQLTPTNGVNAAAVGTGKDYPEHGATLPSQTGATATTAKISGLTAVEHVGLLIVITTGTGAGQVRRISAYNGTDEITVARAWTTQPANGDGYLILVDLQRLGRLHIRSEFDTNAAGAPTASVRPIFYDNPPTTGTAPNILLVRKPIRYEGLELSVDNFDHQTEPEITSYYQSGVRSVDTDGAIGAKIRVLAAPTTGKIALWACGT
jgi:hypothetical protein